MQAAASALLTVEDYRRTPDTGPRYQLIEGELVMSPAPNRYHQEISKNVEFLLMKYLEKNPIGVLYDAPFDVYLNETNVFQPDKVFVANDRDFILTDAGAEGAPNLVIEILSGSTARLDKFAKKSVYTQTGVEGLWVIDPRDRTVEIYFLQRDSERPAAVHKENAVFQSPCFPGLTINATEIFRRYNQTNPNKL